MRAAVIALAAAVVLTGCGREERAEATRLAKILSDKHPNYAKADAIEKEFVSNAKAWCGGITTGGAGKGVELEQNATVATELAKTAAGISDELSALRAALEDQSLKKESVQTVRNDLLKQLIQRQRLLQELRASLDKSAVQFLDFRKDKSYAGDSYPGEMATLDTMLQAYKPPADAVGTALSTLKKDHGIE